MTDAKGRGRRWPRVIARVTSATLAILALAQAVFAGSFLGGQYNALLLHSAGAKVTTVLSVVQVAVLVILNRTGGPRWPIAVGALVTILFVAEFASGELRLTGLHVPLGVLLIVGILRLTAAVWRLPLTAPSASPRPDVIRESS